MIKTNRVIHKWLSLAVSLPLLIIVVSGILLLTRKEFAFIQPETQKGIGQVPSISFEQILALAKSVKQAQINSWDAIDRIDVRPQKGIVKVRAKSSWEIQIDSQTGEILLVAYRRSDFIESLHDGTFLHKFANLWLMLPAALGLLALIITGLVLFFWPYYKKRKIRTQSRYS
jgi:uncharacterized iron-regulated membrane protein